jgi:hypothetical protein
VVHADCDADTLLSSLPANLSINVRGSSSHTDRLDPSAAHADSGNDVASVAPKLKIAWQYEKYMTDATNPITCHGGNGAGAGVGTRTGSRAKALYCCSYDLSGHLQDDIIHNATPFIILGKEKTFENLVAEIISFIQSHSTSNRYKPFS